MNRPTRPELRNPSVPEASRTIRRRLDDLVSCKKNPNAACSFPSHHVFARQTTSGDSSQAVSRECPRNVCLAWMVMLPHQLTNSRTGLSRNAFRAIVGDKSPLHSLTDGSHFSPASRVAV